MNRNDGNSLSARVRRLLAAGADREPLEKK